MFYIHYKASLYCIYFCDIGNGATILEKSVNNEVIIFKHSVYRLRRVPSPFIQMTVFITTCKFIVLKITADIKIKINNNWNSI